MRSITRCPACQTQFFVTEVQLNKHNGEVRCGRCLHVFNAKSQFVEVDVPEPVASAEPAASTSASPDAASKPEKARWPSSDHELLNDHDSFDSMPAKSEYEQEPVADVVELSASSQEIEAFTADISGIATPDHVESSSTSVDDQNLIADDNFDDSKVTDQQASNLNDITRLTYIADSQASYFGDLDRQSRRSGRKSAKQLPWLLSALALLLIAMMQSIYFLRDDIAIYYPNLKPYLVQACQQLGCSINLPQQIELIVIDDSDMQEDQQYEGLVHFSSSLTNKAGFNQAYPNLELTLTDVDDNPVLRRIFKPSEYLPANTDVALGFPAGEEIKIKLAITTQNATAAGYRVYVTY